MAKQMKMKKSTKEYYSKDMEKSGYTCTKIDFMDTRISMKELDEDKFSNAPDLDATMTKPKTKKK